MDFSVCIKIDDAVLIALAVYDALPIDGVDGVPVQRDEFAYTHAGRTQQVDQGKVSGDPQLSQRISRVRRHTIPLWVAEP